MSTANVLLENWQEKLKMLNVEGVAEFLTFGFTLGDKTMRNDVAIPALQIPEIDCSKTSRIEDVYEALKEYFARSIKADTGLALSGGLDSRVLAGIIADLGEKIPTFTYGTSSFEKALARKVAATLELPHYEIEINWSLNEKVIEELKNGAGVQFDPKVVEAFMPIAVKVLGELESATIAPSSH